MRIASLFCIALLAVEARAVEKQTADKWSATLATTSQMLKNRAYGDALPILRGVITEMLGILGPSDATTYVLVVPLIQTALAEEGLGNHRAAVWHWHMAQTLYPKAAGSDLSMFGAPGAFLKHNLLSDPTPEKCNRDRPEGTVLPKVLKTIEPLYPEGARTFRVRGLVIVDVTIGADGVPREPRLVKPLATPMALTALEALRNWTFAPAQLKGKPVETRFCVTINFKLN